MTHVRFKLSTLLMIFTFLAVTIGLGYQVHLLRREVVQLTSDVQALKVQGSAIRVVYPQAIGPATQSPQQAKQSPFRLLNTDVIVDPSMEDGMKASEWELQRRIENYRQRDELDAPQDPTHGRRELFNSGKR